jgi:hypothetical protein
MRLAGPIILLVCGVIALVGVFLPWVGDVLSISGWEAISDFGINDATEPFLVFSGSILLLVFGLPAVIVSANPEGSQRVLLSLCILASLGAALGIGGASWFLSGAINNDAVELLSYGFYASYAAATLGLIFGITTMITAQRAGYQITE